MKLWRLVVTVGLAGAATLTPPRIAAASASTLWLSSTTPAGGAANDTAAVELGVRFRSDTNGSITGLRFYKYAGNTGTHIGNLWTGTGTKLASATFTGETASGWQEVTFASPVAITANTAYVASYHTNTGRYAATADYFTSSLDSAPLHAPPDGVSAANGLYRYGSASAFPYQTYRSTNYWVDVVFASSAATQSPAPASPPTSSTCPCNIWPASTTTPASADGDASAVELGVRFRSDTAGYITGVRFYKHATNGGTHIGSLWTNTGTKLATATFTGETSSGWQQVKFATPVAVAANTTYVASYHTDVGHYAATDLYFGSAADNAPLHALQDGIDGPNNVYRYGATSSFPTDTYRSANYWVDVVFDTSAGTSPAAADTTPPTVFAVTPSPGATNVGISDVVTATFNEMMSAASVNTTTFELRDPLGNIVPASVWAGGETPTSTLRPTLPLAPSTTYTATVRGGANGVKDLAGNPLAADFVWSFTTAPSIPPPPVNCPCTIWNTASTAAAGPDADTSPVELGTRFRSDTNGFITGLRFYKHSTNTGTHVGNLWSNTGALLATATFTGESAYGWQQATLVTPVAITANTTYVVSYHTDAGHYAANTSYFVAAFDNVPLHALQNGVDGPSGVYHYGATSGFPTDTYLSTNYWVDVVFATTIGSGAADVTPPTVAGISPGAGAIGISASAPVTATFSEAIDPATINGNTVQLHDAFGALVPATVTYSSGNMTATLQPTSALASGATYTAMVTGGSVDPRVKDLAGNALAASYSWSFTTTGAGLCPCTMWNSSTTSPIADADPNAVELGVRFRSDASGYITGLRFYKAAGNIGTHIGNLWTNTGVLLARATFVNESPAGWQQVNFATPVAIAANTTYVASYHTDTGHYAANSSYFASAFDAVPLHAMRDGADGPNSVYLYTTTTGFPTQTYQSTNYWVDVVFNTEPTVAMALPAVLSVTPSTGAATPNPAVSLARADGEHAAAFNAARFEIALRIDMNRAAWTGYSLQTFYIDQMLTRPRRR